ncbi:UNVERIFIED_CONTAM: hypothetical protein Slati_2918000 [Sesamum latifolium]|uniref:Integrase catalytic domain-containing protein n=1 Tax=Sesamum latifolium TaxID=2727402 RepID=A0AAW2VE05_9LAMI
MDKIWNYLETGKLPVERGEAKRVKKLAGRFFMEGGRLFKKSFTIPAFRCLRPGEAWEVMREIHEGSCENHSGRSLALKIMRHGYFWPTIQRDNMQMVRKCSHCQIHGNLHHTSGARIEFTHPVWPFDHWGMDLIGSFPPAQGQRKFVLVAVDHFSKWIEAEPLAKITENAVIQFI